ncbi:IclR family transcriptional regulator [Microbacterium esteraromaticum]|nr:IclR family transcriptional regulator [Microbacterium esteraromaticum]
MSNEVTTRAPIRRSSGGGEIKSESSRYSAPAAGCAARVLLTLARSPIPLPIAELARETGSSKSLTFRVLRELEEVDLVTSAGGRGYHLAHGVLEFTGAIGKLGEPEELTDILRELSQESGQTVNFGVLSGFDVLITAKQQPEQALVSVTYVGARVPANCSALGKVLLAELDTTEIERVVPRSLPSLTSRSITDRTEFLREVDESRTAGFAVDLEGAILGRFAIAVPVTLPGYKKRAGLAVTGSMDDYAPEYVEQLHTALSRSARRLTRARVSGAESL